MTELNNASEVAAEKRQHIEKIQLAGEEMYHALADAMPQIVWTARPDGELDYCNQRWSDYTGTNLDESHARGWEMLLHPEDFLKFNDKWMQALRTGESFEAEYRFKRASDGAYRWHLTQAAPIYDVSGQILKWVGTSIDIEDKKREAEAFAAQVSIVEAVADAIISKDLDGIIVSWNNGAQRLYGYSAAEVIGRSSAILIPPEMPDELPHILATLRRGETMEQRETVRIGKDGRRLDVSLILSPIKDNQGKITGIAGIERDITESKLAKAVVQSEIERRQQTEAALHVEMARRQRLETESQSFFDLSVDMLAVIGFDGYLKRLNMAWESCLGYSREELMARPYLDFVHPDDVDGTSAEAEQISKGQDTEIFQNRYLCKDGSYKWLAWRVTSVPEEQLLYATARDITAETEIAQSLAVTMLQLERSNKELQDFASIASHDLQEPLRAIQAFGDRLHTRHGDKLNEEARDYLTRMQNAAGRMRALIQDLLAYSRVTTKTKPFTLVDLATTAHSILPDLALRLEETGGRVEVSELPIVEADVRQMRQLFHNLINNGLKFHRVGVAPIIRIYMQPRAPADASADGPQMVQIVVEDNGIGFDQKYVDRIFAPFERLHNQRAYSGTGIGLAICRKIVERHGGSITAKSVLEQGSQFVIELPLHQMVVSSTSTVSKAL